MGEDRGSNSHATKQASLKFSLNPCFLNVPLLRVFTLPFSLLSSLINLPTIIFHKPSDCSQLHKAIQRDLSKIKPGHTLSLKHGLDIPQLSTHTCIHTHTTTHIQPFNFCNGKVMWCLLTESIINMVKCILLFHVFGKSYQTNEFLYLPTILNARLNIPCLKKLSLYRSILYVLVYFVML